MPLGRWIFTIALLAGAGALAYALHRQGTAPPVDPQAAAMAPPVAIALVERVTLQDRIESLGRLRANESIDVVSEEAGIVEKIFFAEGQHSDSGALLLRLDSREEQAELAAAQAELAEARKQYDRLADLAARNVATAARLDEQTAALHRAQANLQVAEAALAKREVRAPFAGRLGIRRVSPGALVGPGVVITTLDDLSVLKLEFSVPETFSASVEPGMRVDATATAFPGRRFTGAVATVGSRIDPATRAFQVQALLPNPDLKLRPGMLLSVDLYSAPRQSVRIPEEAVQALADELFVYVVEDGIAQRRSVRLGARRDGMAEVTAGLAAGERVVVRGLQALRDGTPVRIVEGGETRQARGEAP